MVRKVMVAILSTLILSFVLTAMSYTPVSEHEPNVYYTPFSSQVWGISTYSGPVFLFCGVPLSFLIDRIARRRNFSAFWRSYLFHFVLYTLATVPAIFVFALVLADNLKNFFQIFFGFLPIGAIASLLYYHVLLLTHAFTNPLKSLKK